MTVDDAIQILKEENRKYEEHRRITYNTRAQTCNDPRLVPIRVKNELEEPDADPRARRNIF